MAVLVVHDGINTTLTQPSLPIQVTAQLLLNHFLLSQAFLVMKMHAIRVIDVHAAVQFDMMPWPHMHKRVHITVL